MTYKSGDIVVYNGKLCRVSYRMTHGGYVIYSTSGLSGWITSYFADEHEISLPFKTYLKLL